MKKILLVACVAVLAFASCGNKTAPAADVDSTATEVNVDEKVDEAVALVQKQLEGTDAEGLKGAVANLQTVYGQLVEEGKLDEAKAYASKIQEFVATNAEAIQKVANGETTILQLIEGVKNLPTNAEATAEDALNAVQADAKTIADAAKDAAVNAAEEQVDAAKEAAAAKVAEATAPAAAKVAEAAAKVDEAANKVNEANKKVEEKVEQAKAVNDAAKKLLGK